jgi:integrase
MDAFENFIYSYGAARDLLARAHRTGSLIEGLVLYVSLIDGLLRIALVLDKQLEDASGDVDFSYIQQEPGGRRYSEKEIYEQAHRRGIITTDMKAKIVDLYERRNAVIHRFFLTDIKYVDLEPWLSSYEEVYEHCYNITDTVKPLKEQLGEVKLKELTAGDVQETLDALAGRLSTRSLQIVRNCLERAIRHAEVRDLVGRNVAALVKAPAGRAGRPSKSLTLEQAQELLRAAGGSRLYAYVVLSVTTGLRTEELRALRWTEVDPDAGTVAVYRAVRATTDTKTPKSRRVLALPRLTVQALREHLDRQAEDRLLAGALWQDHGLVFASSIGTPLDHHNVRREFRRITKAAGLGTDWVPREMRHTFVSLLSSNGTALEDIADLVGHRGTATTETVYRKVIVPELRRGAEVMDRLFT